MRRWGLWWLGVALLVVLDTAGIAALFRYPGSQLGTWLILVGAVDVLITVVFLRPRARVNGEIVAREL